MAATTSLRKHLPTALARDAWLLGLAGWTPLPLLLVAHWLWTPEAGDSGLFYRLAVIYAASIFSFLGGVQWGLALRGSEGTARRRRLFVSVAPSLLAVLALALPSAQGLLMLLPGFLLLLAYELVESGDGPQPRWFRPLRILLTGLVVLVLSVFAAGP